MPNEEEKRPRMSETDEQPEKSSMPFTATGQQRYEPTDREVLPSFWKSLGTFLVEIVKVLVIAAAIVIPVRYFLIQPFYVKGASMEPTFHDNEYLIIDRLSYRLHDVRRGDVVVINNPHDLSEYFIKRVIGLPKEKVEIRDGVITLYTPDQPSGFRLDEAYLPEGRTTSGDTAVTLSDEQYYVLGDNRPASLDSRSFGPIPASEIIGRAWIRAWPFSNFMIFRSPLYGESV
jgi:signal peptidase I